MILQTAIDVDALVRGGVFQTDNGLTAVGGSLVFSGKSENLMKFARELEIQALKQRERDLRLMYAPTCVSETDE